MPAMTKRVNINAKVPVRDIKPPIYGTLNNIVMSTGNILKCLCKRAIVDEILPDGSTVRLTMKNYYTDNGAGLTAAPNPTKKKAAAKTAKSVKVHKPEPIVENSKGEELKPVEESTVVEPEPIVENSKGEELKAVEESTVVEPEQTAEKVIESVNVVEEPVVVEENAEVAVTESEENIKEENVDNVGSQKKDSAETNDESNERVGQGSRQASSTSKKTNRKKK